jgi:hypothetical protein
MLIALFIVAIAGLLFLCAFLGFKEGLRLGLNVTKGITPQPTKNPIQAITDIVEEVKNNKGQKDTQEIFNNMLNYNGDIPKEEN